MACLMIGLMIGMEIGRYSPVKAMRLTCGCTKFQDDNLHGDDLFKPGPHDMS